MKIKTLKDLYDVSEKHPYYCSESSYFGLGFETKYQDWKSFHDEMYGSDFDMNLLFRWDVNKHDSGGYYIQLFFIHQRKGRFVPFCVENICESDVESIVEMLKQRGEYLRLLWTILD